MDDNSNKNTNNSHGFLKFLVCFIIICGCIFGLVKCAEYLPTVNPITSKGNSDGNTKIFSRSARKDDLNFIDSGLDLSSLGAKYTFIPNNDINNLQITIIFMDKNKNIIQQIVKSCGSVKKGVKESFSISLFDFGITTALQIKYTSWNISGGTVSYLK